MEIGVEILKFWIEVSTKKTQTGDWYSNLENFGSRLKNKNVRLK